jgi:hypothetical protein
MADSSASRSAQLNRERVARWYRRQAEPVRAVYRVEVSRDALLHKLIDAGWLSEADSWRRDLVELALSHAIEQLQFPRREP